MLPHVRTRALGVACALGVAVIVGTPALADGVAPSPAPSPSSIGRVVTSDRQDEPATLSARSTYVVTAADIARHGWLTVGDAIEAVPAVELVRYGAQGAEISAEIRGASSDQVLVLLNGRPVPGAQLGGVDLAALSTLGVERIEVVEGPGATLYGSGAVGGVINVITTSSHCDAPLSRIGAGAFGEHDATLATCNLALQSIAATNTYPYALPNGSSGTRTNADERELRGRASVTSDAGPWEFRLDVGSSDRHVGVPGSLAFPTVGERQDDGLDDALARIAFHGARATTALELSAMRERINAFDADSADAGAGLFNGTSTEARTQLSLRDAVVGGPSRLVYGLDLSREAVLNDDGAGDLAADTLAQSALYVQESYGVAATARVVGGLRAENDAGYGGALSPSLGAIVEVAPGIAVRANAATAFRAPTAAELYFPNFGNPRLRPERTSGGDVSLDFDRIAGGASLTWFFQQGRDLIAYDATANTDVNVARSSVAGLTLSLATVPLDGVRMRLNLTDTYRALDLTSIAVRLPYRPVFTSNVDVAYEPRARGALDAVGFVAHSEGLRDPSGALPFTRVDGYVRVHVTRRALLSLRGTNLGNEQYQGVAGYPAPGRGYSVELATR
jgi:outer membrane cobalamin receptor